MNNKVAINMLQGKASCTTFACVYVCVCLCLAQVAKANRSVYVMNLDSNPPSVFG